jgi:hypothetical protein
MGEDKPNDVTLHSDQTAVAVAARQKMMVPQQDGDYDLSMLSSAL